MNIEKKQIMAILLLSIQKTLGAMPLCLSV